LKEIKNYEKVAFGILNDSKILEETDINELMSMKDELKDVFLHSQVFRTRTEMEVSVLNDVKFGTPDSKYWQSVREQNVMFQELVMLSYDYRKNLIEIKKKEREFKSEEDELEKELIEIDIEKLKFTVANQERTAKDRIREIKDWKEIKSQLIPKMEYSLTDVNEHQLLSYAKRFLNQMIVTGGAGSPSEKQNLIGQLTTTLKTVNAKGLTEKLLKTFNDKDRKLVENNFGPLLIEDNGE